MISKSMNEFSGGWQMRVELAKILLKQNDCIMLDEPQTIWISSQFAGWKFSSKIIKVQFS